MMKTSEPILDCFCLVVILGQVSEQFWKGYLTVNDGPVLEITQTCNNQKTCPALINFCSQTSFSTNKVWIF